MGKIAVPALRIVLGALLAGLVYVQVTLFPNATIALIEDPRALTFRLGMMVMAFLAILTVEIVIVCAWRLVTMVRHGTVLSDAALRQLNVAFGALVTFAVLLVPFTAFHLVADTLATPHYFVVAVIGVGVVAGALGVRVVRRLLVQAIARDSEAARMEAELDEVI